ncbi:MAG: copper resistance CopC family protein [Mycobacterium sp.]
MKIGPALAVTAVLTASGLISPGIAAAHDWVVNSSPAENSTGPAPSQVSITFNEPVTNAEIWVTGTDHAAWSTGSTNGSGAAYSIALRPSLPAGEYTVHWKNNAADGDDVHSSWLFTVR